MLNNELNIFEFATKELSQDAVLLYLADCYNDPSRRAVGEKFLCSFYGDITGLQKVHPIKQYCHIDVLIVLQFIDRLEFLIIEDKINSREHSNQLERYKKEIAEGNYLNYGVPSDLIKGAVKCVYFKPIVYNDNEAVVVDKNGYRHVNYKALSEVLEIVHDDPILLSFREFFKKRFYKEDQMVSLHSFAELKEKFPNVNDIMESACGQWMLLKLITEETLDSENYQSGKQYNGTSYGVPWTQYRFVVDRHSNPNDWDNLDFQRVVRGRFSYFFRLDRENNGYYLSINQYIWDKKEVNEDKKAERSILAKEAHLDYIPNNYKESKMQVIYFDDWNELEKQLSSLKNTMQIILDYNLDKYKEENRSYIGKR